jgi:signal transduction histidine kinase
MSLSSGLLTALGRLVLERQGDGRFVHRGGLPPWCLQLGAPQLRDRAPFSVEEVFPFLESFLPDAERVWRDEGPPRVYSEFWTEVTPDGEELHLEATAVHVDGQALLVVSRNERLFLEASLVLQRARELHLAHASLMREIEHKDVLMHCIVHDLAAPLHSILGGLSLLSELSLPAPGTQWIGRALDAALRQRELIQEILYVFSVEHDALVALPQTALSNANLSAAIGQLAAEFQPAAQRSRVRIQTDAEPRGVSSVVGEEARLRRVLSNLIENSLRHSPPGEGVVRVALDDQPDALVVAVEDDGPGVAPELAGRLFQKLVRGRDSRAGTGLGLYFCRITVERWGGTIGYQARPGGGARFWIRLPKIESRG